MWLRLSQTRSVVRVLLVLVHAEAKKARRLPSAGRLSERQTRHKGEKEKRGCVSDLLRSTRPTLAEMRVPAEKNAVSVCWIVGVYKVLPVNQRPYVKVIEKLSWGFERVIERHWD